jgi:hypothetical protein
MTNITCMRSVYLVTGNTVHTCHQLFSELFKLHKNLGCNLRAEFDIYVHGLLFIALQ